MSANKEVRPDLRYSKDHEWARLDGAEVIVGITAFAVGELGDITLVTYDVEPGARVAAGDVFGTIESVKTLSDLFAPVAGTVVAVNSALEDAPETVNEDAWDAGWMLRLQPDSATALDELLTPAAYQELIDTSE